MSLLSWNSRKIRRKVRSSLGAECAAFSTGLEHTDLLRVLWGELSGDLKYLEQYELYLQATEAMALNDCKSLADALRSTGAAASKASEDKRLAIEMSMIKQRLNRHETRFQWVENEMMAADVLTKGRERGNTELLQELMVTARYQIKPTEEMLERKKAKKNRKAKAVEAGLLV